MDNDCHFYCKGACAIEGFINKQGSLQYRKNGVISQKSGYAKISKLINTFSDPAFGAFCLRS